MSSDSLSVSKNPLEFNLQRVFTEFQTHCSAVLHNFSQNTVSLQSHLLSSFSILQGRAKNAPGDGMSRPSSVSNPLNGAVWARISGSNAPTPMIPGRRPGGTLSAEAIEQRLEGVAVYALSNSNEEFVLVSGASTGRSLGLLFCKKEDAESLLRQMKSMNPGMRKEGSRVVALALNKVFKVKVNGVAFRLIPESDQVTHALQEREKAGIIADGFEGVPVFQSRSLILRSQNKSYRPVFFRKEDLERSLQKASRQQNQLNPSLKPGDIQVGVFEEIIKGMQDSSTSKWNDVVFIPPGLEVSADPKRLSATTKEEFAASNSKIHQ